MLSLSCTEFRRRLGEFVNENGPGRPIQVRFRGKPAAVLVPEEEYRALVCGRIALEQLKMAEEKDVRG